ncbi:DNA-binding protein [Pseudomonas entomophila]|uniref:DNA-binding protein n=1 Tax=Pseudomonas entomophila TaxID=312306 RepID=UPI003EBE9D58
MARGGINKALVQHARQALLDRGEHPSIDAVRIEMGNTGSKTTIHRYMKELEDQASVPGDADAYLGDRLGRLVQDLSTQLLQEADAQVRAAHLDFEERQATLNAALEAARLAQASAERQVTIQTEALAAQAQELETTTRALQTEQTRNAGLNQALGEWQVRLADKAEQVRSLEDKHQHARDALEHYRAATREQREQEQRRHEAQVQQLQMEVRQLQQAQIVKQDELTRLHRDNERLLADARQGAKTQDQLRDALERKDGQIQGLIHQVAQGQGIAEELRRQLEAAQVQVATLQAEAHRQDTVLVQLERQVAQQQERLDTCETRLAAEHAAKQAAVEPGR